MLYLVDIYAAGEAPIEGISSEKLANDVRGQGHKAVEYIGDVKTAAEKIMAKLKPGDLFLTLGAGNGYQVGEQLLKLLK